MAYGIHYKIGLEENELIKDYGHDVPVYRTDRWYEIYYYYYHFGMMYLPQYLSYSEEEQVLDPLNDNILSPEIFQIYEKKRNIKFRRYYKRRDDSFDFLNIG